MKKGLKVIFMAAAVVLLSGCYRLNTAIEIKDDKSGTIEYVMAVDTKAFSEMQSSSTGGQSESDGSDTFKVEDYEELKAAGCSVEEYKDSDKDHEWTGVKIKCDINNIDEHLTDSKDPIEMMNGNNTSGDPVIDKLFYKEGNTYYANHIYNFSDDSSISADQIKSMFDMNYTVKLPREAISNNATSKEGTTYTWNIEYGKKTEVSYAFELSGKNATNTESKSTSSKSNIIMYVAIGGVVIAVVTTLLFFLVANSNKKETK